MLVLAVTLHNIPEGMAVGVVAAGALTGDVGLSLGGGLALAIGLAIQNIPEGAIISLPLRSSGLSRGRAFGYGALSGIVEPIAAILTILCVEYISGALQYVLAFAAGAMIYVVVEELIPQSQNGGHSNIPTITFAIGFALMMILDVALG
jgi:ZIP family zinc transporter